ncbi:hypothetical protein [Spartinivicinus poritis]|uniref:Uncharacterized protein n=1 Tax=Spartinivicinus poritis TaxID=2994640 RepID=A0ABT5UGN3_9GAMM|nr:hypothetical protein [Spartinivicinus sp. A2-2]MDE1465518.1 hypothetical protein [Spartinivicinus sp. A2-2]
MKKLVIFALSVFLSQQALAAKAIYEQKIKFAGGLPFCFTSPANTVVVQNINVWLRNSSSTATSVIMYLWEEVTGNDFYTSESEFSNGFIIPRLEGSSFFADNVRTRIYLRPNTRQCIVISGASGDVLISGTENSKLNP